MAVANQGEKKLSEDKQKEMESKVTSQEEDKEKESKFLTEDKRNVLNDGVPQDETGKNLMLSIPIQERS